MVVSLVGGQERAGQVAVRLTAAAVSVLAWVGTVVAVLLAAPHPASHRSYVFSQLLALDPPVVPRRVRRQRLAASAAGGRGPRRPLLEIATTHL